MYSIIGRLKDILCEEPGMTNRTLHRLTEAIKKAPAHLGEQTAEMLSTLAPREEVILRMRFGIGQKATTLEELSQQLSLTHELIRQIEVQALRKVRQRTRSLYSRASLGTLNRGSQAITTSSLNHKLS